jgi:hypothetical protein
MHSPWLGMATCSVAKVKLPTKEEVAEKHEKSNGEGTPGLWDQGWGGFTKQKKGPGGRGCREELKDLYVGHEPHTHTHTGVPSLAE